MFMLAVAVISEPRHDHMVQQDDPERSKCFADAERDGVIIVGRVEAPAGMNMNADEAIC